MTDNFNHTFSDTKMDIILHLEEEIIEEAEEEVAEGVKVVKIQGEKGEFGFEKTEKGNIVINFGRGQIKLDEEVFREQYGKYINKIYGR